MRTIALVIGSLLLLTGCSRQPTTNLVFRDPAGSVVARGSLKLPTPLPAPGQPFRGPWRLTASTGTFPVAPSAAAHYRGEVANDTLSINLHPQMADNNVSLVAPVTSGTLSGTWHHATIAGPREMGTFTLSRVKN